MMEECRAIHSQLENIWKRETKERERKKGMKLNFRNFLTDLVEAGTIT